MRERIGAHRLCVTCSGGLHPRFCSTAVGGRGGRARCWDEELGVAKTFFPHLFRESKMAVNFDRTKFPKKGKG